MKIPSICFGNLFACIRVIMRVCIFFVLVVCLRVRIIFYIFVCGCVWGGGYSTYASMCKCIMYVHMSDERLYKVIAKKTGLGSWEKVFFFINELWL